MDQRDHNQRPRVCFVQFRQVMVPGRSLPSPFLLSRMARSIAILVCMSVCLSVCPLAYVNKSSASAEMGDRVELQ